MKSKIVFILITFLIFIINILQFKNNQLLKGQLKEKENIIKNIQEQHFNNSLDSEKINQEIKNYQEENKKLLKEIKNIKSDCLRSCKISEELKNILKL